WNGLPLPLIELNSLEYLQILHISFSDYTEKSQEQASRLMDLIFNDINTMNSTHLRSTLKTLRIEFYVPTNTCHPDRFRPSKTNIQNLEIRQIYFHDFIRLLPSLELLRSIKVEFESRYNATSGISVFDDVDIKSILIPHCSVLILPFYKTDITFMHMKYLLKCTPSLTKLQIDVYKCCSELRGNHQEWKVSLANYCKNLQKFKFNYWFNMDLSLQEEKDLLKNFKIAFPETNEEQSHPEASYRYVHFTVCFKK
ncbi:unnamed protein product, partial [Rotaria socialis]